MDSKQPNWLEKARKSAGWIVVFGIVEVVAGFLSIASPFVAGLTVTVMVGVAFLMDGAHASWRRSWPTRSAPGPSPSLGA